MKALACLLTALCLAMVYPVVAADPDPPAAKAAAPAEEAPDFVKLREALAGFELDPEKASDVFLAVYQMFAKGEELAREGNVPEAKIRFEAAMMGLEAIRKRVPTWNPAIVDFRMKRVLERLAALPGQAETAPAPAPEVTPQPAPAPKTPSTFKEENRLRPAPRKWDEREFNGEKLYVVPLRNRYHVPLMVTPESAGFPAQAR